MRTTLQFIGTVVPEAGESAADAQLRAVGVAAKWLASKFPDEVPSSILSGESVEQEVPGQILHCISLLDEGIWSARLVQPDAPYGEKAAVPGRTWTTEIALARDAQTVRVGVRVACASLAFATERIDFTRPRVVRDLIGALCVCDGRPLCGIPWSLSASDDLQELEALLSNGDRSLPVFLLSPPDSRRLGLKTAPYMLDAESLATRCEGLAHVVTMPAPLTHAWTELVGKEWSAYMGAVRTYRPGLDFLVDDPRQHPLALPEKVLAFTYRGRTAEEAFEEFLVAEAYSYAASKRVQWKPCVFHADATRLRAEKARRGTRDAEELARLYEVELAALRDKNESLEAEAEAHSDDALEAMRERDRYAEENDRLRHHVDALRASLAAKLGRNPDQSVEVPDDFEEMPEWVAQHLVGRLVLHPRAVRALKDAAYSDVGLVYKALLLLANDYRDMRLGSRQAMESFNARLMESALECSQAISRERAGEQGEAYYVRYPAGSHEPRLLEWHLKKGESKDARYCLRIYFFWHEDTRQVVVGWLCGHLESRVT